MMEFKEEKIPEGSLIIGDSRIYRGEINWAFHGRPYLEGSEFMQILGQQDQALGEPRQINVYYFECVIDDCGWGTVKDQPEFNASMEALTDLFKQNEQLIKQIKEPDKSQNYQIFSSAKKVNTINIYQMTISLKGLVIEHASRPKQWFLYTIGYEPKEGQFDYYETFGLGALLDKVAHWIAKLAAILAFISPLYVIYLLRKWKPYQS